MKLLKITILLTALIALSCGVNRRFDATSVGKKGWIFEGWACAPNQGEALKGRSPAEYCDTDDIKKNDYLYMKFTASAKQSVVDEGRVGKIEGSCRRAAKDIIQRDALEKIIGAYVEATSGTEDSEATGDIIMSQVRGRISGVGVYNCCAMDNDSGACKEPGEAGYAQAWAECQCVGYLKYPGGQKAFMAAAERAQDDQ